MPDLGIYATEVIACYLVTLVGLGALVVTTLRRAARVRAELDAVEAKDD